MPTPPSAVTGLVVADAHNGKINLWWDKSTAEDFDHYNVYISELAITDATDITPAYQIKAISTTIYQAAGLKAGTRYYFAVTAVDKVGNENKQISASMHPPRRCLGELLARISRWIVMSLTKLGPSPRYCLSITLPESQE